MALNVEEALRSQAGKMCLEFRTVQPAGGPVVTTMRIQTTQAVGAIRRTRSAVATLFLGMGLPTLLSVVVVCRRQKRSSVRVIAGLLMLLLLSVSCWVGCSGVHPPLPDQGSLPTGPIPLRVTATTGGNNPIFHTLNLTMTLQ
jgi:hypothetical protein